MRIALALKRAGIAAITATGGSARAGGDPGTFALAGPMSAKARPVFVKTREENGLSDTDETEQSGTPDSDEQDVDAATRSPAEQAQERQKEMEESGQENPA